MQVGTDPDQLPLAEQVLVESPWRMNPELQLYVATEPTLLPLEKLIPPLAIPDKEPQVAIIYDHKLVTS